MVDDGADVGVDAVPEEGSHGAVEEPLLSPYSAPTQPLLSPYSTLTQVFLELKYYLTPKNTTSCTNNKINQIQV